MTNDPRLIDIIRNALGKGRGPAGGERTTAAQLILTDLNKARFEIVRKGAKNEH